MKGSIRFLLAVAMIVLAAVFLHSRSHNEIIPAREPLRMLPEQLADWKGIDVAIPQDELDILGPGDFLLRVYRNSVVQEPYVDLFIAYFPSQRTGDTIHSPKNCLPGAGWSPVESRRTMITIPGRASFPVNRYVIAKGGDRQLVLYWYLAHNRAVASEYWAKFYLVADSIRLNRSDGSMIRITTPLRPEESADTAQQRLLSFADQLVPSLNAYIPR
jgi:EpsI family protein